jgi:hypothetical protein
VQRAIREISPWWIAAAGALELASCVSFVIIFRLFLDRVGARDARALAWTEIASGALLPGGGVGGYAIGGWLLHLTGAPTRWIVRRSGGLFFLTSAVNSAAGSALGCCSLPEPPARTTSLARRFPRCSPARPRSSSSPYPGARLEQLVEQRVQRRVLAAVAGARRFDVALVLEAPPREPVARVSRQLAGPPPAPTRSRRPRPRRALPAAPTPARPSLYSAFSLREVYAARFLLPSSSLWYDPGPSVPS